MLVTTPGVQKPHWLPCMLESRSWMTWGSVALPMPSTVMMCAPSTRQRGMMQALMVRRVLGS